MYGLIRGVFKNSDVQTYMYLIRSIIIWWLCLVLSEASQKKFLGLCKEGDLEAVKTMLTEDPSLINRIDSWGKVQIQLYI